MWGSLCELLLPHNKVHPNCFSGWGGLNMQLMKETEIVQYTLSFSLTFKIYLIVSRDPFNTALVLTQVYKMTLKLESKYQHNTVKWKTMSALLHHIKFYHCTLVCYKRNHKTEETSVFFLTDTNFTHLSTGNAAHLVTNFKIPKQWCRFHDSDEGHTLRSDAKLMLAKKFLSTNFGFTGRHWEFKPLKYEFKM